MKIKTIIFIIIFFIGGVNITYCQQKDYIYFDSIYNCNNIDYSCAFTTYETYNGYITAGISEDIIGANVICILKTDKYGNNLDIKNYEKPFFHYWPGVEGSFIKTTDGGYALGGGISNSQIAKAALVKFNANGDTMWTKEYSDNIIGSVWTARQCKQTKDSGFVLIGEKDIDAGTHNIDVLLIKTDSLGNEKWQKNYGDVNIDEGWTVVVTPDNGYLIGGYTWNWYSPYSRNALVIKTDSLGNVQWQKEFGGAFDDGAAIVNVAKDGNYIVGYTYATAQIYSTEPSDSRFNIIKLNHNGDIIWDKKYANSRFACNISFIDGLNDGRIIVTGYGNPYTTNGGNAWRKGMILEISSNGDSLWMRDYMKVHNNGSLNNIYHIQQTSDHGFIACGEVFGAWEPPNGQNMWLLKMDSAGCLEPNCDGVKILEPFNSSGSFKIYPNPASDIITINLPGFKNPSPGLCLKIYNIQGQMLLQQNLVQNNTEIDISQLEQGIYVAKIRLDDGSFILEKFVVVK